MTECLIAIRKCGTAPVWDNDQIAILAVRGIDHAQKKCGCAWGRGGVAGSTFNRQTIVRFLEP